MSFSDGLTVELSRRSVALALPFRKEHDIRRWLVLMLYDSC